MFKVNCTPIRQRSDCCFSVPICGALSGRFGTHFVVQVGQVHDFVGEPNVQSVALADPPSEADWLGYQQLFSPHTEHSFMV